MIKELDFKPPRLLRNGHVQTVLPELLAARLHFELELHAENIDAVQQFVIAKLPAKHASNKVLLIIPGIEGSYKSSVAKLLLHSKYLNDYTIYILSHRGIHTPNKNMALYNAGMIDDLDRAVQYILTQQPKAELQAVGFSMGSNMLLRYLSKHHNVFQKAIAVSTPFDLDHCSTHTPKFYNKKIIQNFRSRIQNSIMHPGVELLNKLDWGKITTVREFDIAITAPYFGYASVEDYYAVNSCKKILRDITTPTILLSSADDPFIDPNSWPVKTDLSHNMQFLTTKYGGHMAFITYRKGCCSLVVDIILG